MIDYDQPWGWTAPKQQTAQSNTISPLGPGGDQGGGNVIQAGPSQQDQMKNAVGGALVKEGMSSAMKGMAAEKAADLTAQGAASMIGEGASSAAGSQAAMLASQMSGFGAEGAAATGEALGAAGAASSVMGPLGAAMGGLAKGEYDEAAGAALGSVLGAYFGPIGSMIGGKIGGYAGNAVGSVFGYAEGTTNAGAQPAGAAGPSAPAAGGKGVHPAGSAADIDPAVIQQAAQASGAQGGKGAGPAAPAGGAPAAGAYVKPQVTGKYYGELNQAYNPAAVGKAKVQAQQNPQGGKGAGPAAPAGPTTGAPLNPYPAVTLPNPSTRPEAQGPDPLAPYDPTWFFTPSGGENPYEGNWKKLPVDKDGNAKTQPDPHEAFDPNWKFTPVGGENPYEGNWGWVDPNPDPMAMPYNPNQV